jgi:hypothetical protein
VRTGEADLRDFSILYLCFTLVLVAGLLKKYLSLNVESYSARAWYGLAGAEQVLGFAVIVAAIHFFTGVYGVRYRKGITLAFLAMMLVCIVLLFSPIGAVLDAGARIIRFGTGYKITAVWYFAVFTVMLALGYGLLRRLWHTERRNFLIGLLVFATVGYLETAANLPGVSVTVVKVPKSAT